jgi:hypothetical protein
MHRTIAKARLTQAALAFAALAIGLAVYATDRGGNVAFIPSHAADLLSVRHVFGAFNGALPTFVHVFAFALLTVLVVGTRSRQVGLACLAWTLIDALFEVAQLNAIGPRIIGPWLAGIGLPAPARSFFERGTFSTFDIVAASLGGAAAYLIVKVIWKEEFHAEKAAV